MKIYAKFQDYFFDQSDLDTQLPFIEISSGYDVYDLYRIGTPLKFVVKSGSGYRIIKCKVGRDNDWCRELGLDGFDSVKMGDALDFYANFRFMCILVCTTNAYRGIAYYCRLPDTDIADAIHYIAAMYGITNFVQSSDQSQRYHKLNI